LICCADIQHQPSRHAILRHVNLRLQPLTRSGQDQFELHSSANAPVLNRPYPDENQFKMTPTQFQAVRLEAYHLWLEAGRPVGKEIEMVKSETKGVSSSGPAASEAHKDEGYEAKKSKKLRVTK
jgi:hypothetical protein